MRQKIVKPVLGTAMWGWTTPASVCFELLDEFYAQGYRTVDGATNYPINKNPDDWRKSEHILLEWIRANGVKDLKVMMKVGSLNNLKTPDHNLTKSFLLMNLGAYQGMFDSNLETFMVHWDNRSEQAAIDHSFEVFEIAKKEGLKVGFSGIQHPDLYWQANQKHHFEFTIQIKHNLLHSDYKKYQLFHNNCDFIAYGINAGGIKLTPENYSSQSSLKARAANWNPPATLLQKARHIIDQSNLVADRKPLETFNHLGMIYATYFDGINGILLGTSRINQLKESLAYLLEIQNNSYEDVFALLQKSIQ